jgi:uncharacterized protein YjbJ (UPF0337 family)
MDRDRIEGAGREAVGKVKQAVGQVVDDHETEARGALDEARGTAQNLYGQAKDTARSLASDAADQVSNLRDQAGEIGQHYVERAQDIGSRYYREGNRAVSERVGDQHLAALLVAGAAGYLLAWLLHGRR